MPTRKNCISCHKEMGEKRDTPFLDYKNLEWCISQNKNEDSACNWCYWYAWDNVVRIDSLGNFKKEIYEGK